MKKIILGLVCSVFSMSFAWADADNAAPVQSTDAAGSAVVSDATTTTNPVTTAATSSDSGTVPATTDANGSVQAAPVSSATEADATPTPAVPTEASTPAVDTTETPIQLSKSMQIVSKVEKFADAKLSYTVKVKYPLIQGANLTAGAKAFNKAIANVVKDQMLQFKTTAVLDQVNMKNLPEELRKDSFSMDYDVDVVKPKGATLISVRLSIEGMQAGRAHPFHAKRVMNFDLAAGHEISLAQLFKPHSRYLQAIAAYSTKSLDEKLKKDAWMVAGGTKPDPKNFKNWNLQEDSILITFDEYQVAPYVYGPQEVEIPYSALKKILSAKAPIAECAKESKGCEVG